jgi:hypothetical protein
VLLVRQHGDFVVAFVAAAFRRASLTWMLISSLQKLPTRGKTTAR